MKNFHITPEEKLFYDTNGYLSIRNVFTTAEIKNFREEIDKLIDQLPKLEKYEGYQRVFQQVQMVWQKSSILKSLTMNRVIARAVSCLSGVENLRVFLDQILCKHPGADATRPHQDAPYLSYDDSNSINCWIAIDDTNQYNGNLEYFPRSHELGLLRLVHLDQTRDNLLEDFPAVGSIKPVPVESLAGDIIFHNCYTVHQAPGNSTNASRRAYSMQYMSDKSRYNGWLHPFMKKYSPNVGDELIYDCFPKVYSSG
ncbi:MAG TPA: phytanoyl-CoA dioxygenase family protein [Gammaproteobacteria bacterium]|nr:phytanoyl-CoA dioxygenase family protein [Gammaproteobacteria bacterium]